MKTQTVEILVHVSQTEESVFSGEYILRALDADGTLLHEAHVTLPDLDAATSDYARLLTLTMALGRLHGKLGDGPAWYALRVIQSSKNVDGWLDKGWKRNAERVRELAGAVDVLLRPFPRREFIKLSREELDAALKTGKGVMIPA